MPKWIKKTVYWTLGAVAVIIVAAFLVLEARFFSDWRRSVVQDILSEQIGQTLIIDTDVRAKVGATSRLTVLDARIPSQAIDDLNLAELKLLELDVDLFDLLRGALTLDNIQVEGLRMNLVRQEDGTPSWSGSIDNVDDRSEQTRDEIGIVPFLSDKNADIASVILNVDDQRSGFEFLFDLETLTLKQIDDGDSVEVSGRGKVNAQPFRIAGNYPRGAVSSTSVTMGGVELDMDGQRLPQEQGGGYSVDVTLDTGEIGNLLEILRLNRTMEGTGTLNARLVRQANKLAVRDIETVVQYRAGPEITLEGTVDDLLSSVDFDVTVSGRMYPEDAPPEEARDIKDLQLTHFAANIVSDAGAVEVKQVLLETNSFENEFQEIGPVTVASVRRTDNDTLALKNIVAHVGPREAPFVVATGDVSDLLQLRQFDFTGTLNAPASLILPEFKRDTANAFGGVVGEFEVSDASGQLSLTKLQARSEGTDLWTMQADAAVRSVKSVEGLDFQIDLEVPDAAAFLSALGLDTVDAGPVVFSLAVEGKQTGLMTRTTFGVGQSRAVTELETAVDKRQQATVRGSIRSELLNIDDLRKAVAVAIQVASLNAESGTGGAAGKPQGREIQPLVLEEQTPASVIEARADGRVMQPLVLEEADINAQGEKPAKRKDGRVVQPLVLEEAPRAEGVAGLVNLEQIGRDLDLEIAIEIAKVTGQAGVSSVSSALVSKDGKADLGPVEFRYGGGYFNVGAEIDFVESPDLARISGATSGWDIGKILADIGTDIRANGKLRAQFDLTGQHKSARGFIDSMQGSVTISMVNGAVATSLLELAGLGLFPWLFSQELQQGYTSIVCVVAPLRISAGRVSSNAIVAETKSVQLVAAGSADWRQDQIAIRAEPRPVGRPLARSAWPFEVTGRLSSPDFKIGGGSKRKPKQKGAGSGQAAGTRTPCKPDIRQSQ